MRNRTLVVLHLLAAVCVMVAVCSISFCVALAQADGEMQHWGADEVPYVPDVAPGGLEVCVCPDSATGRDIAAEADSIWIGTIDVRPGEPWAEPARLANIRSAILDVRPGLAKAQPDGYLTALTLAVSRHTFLHGLDWRLIVPLIFAESSFEQYAKGPPIPYRGRMVRCKGLMQLHPCHGIDDVFDIEVNVSHGCEIYRRYLDSANGSIRGGLRRYGTGPGIPKVLRLYERLKRKYEG